MQHDHYTVIAYGSVRENGDLLDVASIEVIVMPNDKPEIERLADSRRLSPLDPEQVAIERAMTKVKKPSYRVSAVRECFEDIDSEHKG